MGRSVDFLDEDGNLSAASQTHFPCHFVRHAEIEHPGLAVLDRVERFLMWAKQEGAHETYIARHRRPWWRVGLREPPPIMASYMARRPPVFTRNAANARCINIAHGLYPREALSERTLRALVAFLNATTSTNDGRTYAGGLTKFEPKEMERLCVPRPELLGRHLSES